jgi:pimeloyl-ACP methyl ester carboxylesterase
MKMHLIVIPVVLAIMGCNKTEKQQKTVDNKPAREIRTGYANVNGLRMYYEILGKGEPLILLHGAYMNAGGPIRQTAERLSLNRMVVIAELQGHGRTNDAERAITYEGMADDVAELARQLKIDSADITGYSMGAGVAMQLAIRHPQLVKKAILISGSYSDEGMQPSLKPMIPQMTAAAFDGTPMRAEYDSLAPDPKHFPQLVEKLKVLDTKSYDWEKDYVKIKNPLLLIFGDSDAITTSHMKDMFEKQGGNVMGDLQPMPKVQLAILPHTSHMGVMNRIEWFIPMIEEFLGIKK